MLSPVLACRLVRLDYLMFAYNLSDRLYRSLIFENVGRTLLRTQRAISLLSIPIRLEISPSDSNSMVIDLQIARGLHQMIS